MFTQFSPIHSGHCSFMPPYQLMFAFHFHKVEVFRTQIVPWSLAFTNPLTQRQVYPDIQKLILFRHCQPGQKGTHVPGLFLPLSGLPLIPSHCLFLFCFFRENLSLVHGKCSETLICCVYFYVSISCCLLNSHSLPSFFLSHSSPRNKLTEARLKLPWDYPDGRQREQRADFSLSASLTCPGFSAQNTTLLIFMRAVHILLSATCTNQLAASGHAWWLSLFPQMSPRQQYEEPIWRKKADWVGAGHVLGRVDRREEGAFGSVGACSLALESCGITSCAHDW